ncbi:MAG: sn-glycerol-1-phosphate dehydrogenase [Rubrobacteraceae bacterium]
MSGERINAALQEASDTQDVVIGAGTLASVGEVLEKNFGDRTAVVVADENTFEAAGKEVQQHLEEAGCELVESYIFPGEPTLYAEYGNIETLVEALGENEAIPVAVGAGTLNDIVKRASYECNRPYMNVSTAASTDGATAFGASIEKEDKKQTLECPAPRAVLADLDVLENAPSRMTASGYADLLGKVTSGADWLIADRLGVEEIDETGWSLVQDHLREWIGEPRKLSEGDQQEIENLIEGLIMSGLGMQSYQSSRTASGAEHQFSHLWEGEGLGRDQNPPLSHGFKVGVGTISIAALYERMLGRDFSDLDVDAACESWPSWEEMEEKVRKAYSGSKLEDVAVNETESKYIDADTLRERLELLRERWPELREKLTEQLMPAEQIETMLKTAGCPITPKEIGLDWESFQETYQRAQMLRKRYTVLDLAVETGILDECVEELFAPAGFWGSRR